MSTNRDDVILTYTYDSSVTSKGRFDDTDCAQSVWANGPDKNHLVPHPHRIVSN